MHRNAGKKAYRHRYREKICDPAQTENSGCENQKSDHERESCSKHQVFWRAGRDQKSKTSSKDRRYGRIRAARQEAIASEYRECQRACQKGEKADLWGKPTQ